MQLPGLKSCIKTLPQLGQNWGAIHCDLATEPNPQPLPLLRDSIGHTKAIYLTLVLISSFPPPSLPSSLPPAAPPWLSPALCEGSLSKGYLAVSGLMGHRCGFKLLHGRLEMSKVHQLLAWRWEPCPGSLPWAVSMGNPCNHAQPRELGVSKSEHVE